MHRPESDGRTVKPVTITIDAMSGDRGAAVVVAASLRAVRENEALSIVLVGIRSELEALLREGHARIRIVEAADVVRMNERPSHALRHKKNSSMAIALSLVRDGEAQGCVSAGNTGASMATAKFVLKLISDIERPAIGTLMPSVNRNHPFVLLDIGANIDCKPSYLFQFALMGDAYARTMLKLENPRVALLNNGEEEGKGNQIVQDAFKLLERSTLNFLGNIEGKAMFQDQVDIVVCDGFVGNIALKVAEGTFDFVRSVLKQEIQNSWLAQIGSLAMRAPFQSLKDRADYSEVGGAPLLGINGVVIICHGNSKPHTIRNAILHARQCAELNLNDTISREVSENLSLLQEGVTDSTS